MTAGERRDAVAAAVLKVAGATALLQEALAVLRDAVHVGHDAVVGIADAQRATQIASVKLRILERRTP